MKNFMILFLPDWKDRDDLLEEYYFKISDGLVPYYPERNLIKDIDCKFVTKLY